MDYALTILVFVSLALVAAVAEMAKVRRTPSLDEGRAAVAGAEGYARAMSTLRSKTSSNS